MERKRGISVLWQALALLARCDRMSFLRSVLYVVLQSLLPLLNLYLLKLLVDSVEKGYAAGLEVQSVMPCIVAMTVVFFVNRAVSALNSVNNDVLSQKLVDYMSDIMQRQAAELDMAYYDTPQYHDTLHRAQQEASYRPMQIMNNFMSLGGAVISVTVVMGMLLSASWWIMAVMVVAVLPGFAIRMYKARCIYRFRRTNTQLYRQTAYYSALLTARDYAKEIRAYRLTPMFRQRYVESRRRLVGRLLAISRWLGLFDIVCGAIEAVAVLAVVWLLAGQAFASAISIGTFVMLFEAFRRGQSYLSTLVASVAALYDNRLFVGNLFEFLDLKPQILPPTEPVPFPAKVQKVEFRNVTFRYPEMDRDVLKDYNLTASMGCVTSIAGPNGYGKSTLVKLLLRLYEPQGGEILVDGIDIRRFALDDLRLHVGVLFQDFTKYNLTARENIALTEESTSVDKAAKMAGADGFLGGLRQGYDTMLGRMFDGGSELSSGQWQRVALARALHTDAPVLVLDEPAAWLDQASRRILQDTIEEIKKDKVIILISHI